jgi:hypothetical protein
MLIPRLHSQSSAANLSVQPPIIATKPLSVPATTPQSAGLPAAYHTAYTMPSTPSEAFASASVPANQTQVVEALQSEEMLLQTRLLGSNDDLLKAEIESLRRSVTAQEDRIVQLTKDLQASHENERRLKESEHKMGRDLEVARNEVAHLSEELRRERMAREQADFAAQEALLSADRASQAAQEAKLLQSQAHDRSAGTSSGRRTPADHRNPQQRGRDSSMDTRRQKSQPQQPSTPTGDTRRGAGADRPKSAKDEIDGRLQDLLERTDVGITFRRLNRGWYAFRKKGEKGPLSGDRSVEVSIVNGKLMARLEPSTHDNGWNNGKLGPIERFAAAMSQL